MNDIDPIVLIIIFSSTVILSYFFNLYSKRSGIPSVLLLIFTGMLINFGFFISEMGSPNLFSILKVLGVVGLALIVLEAALDLKLVKEKAGLIFKSLSTAVLGLFATSYVGALVVNYAFSMPMIEALLFTVPLSILSSAIILPSLGSLNDYKKEFMIYESTFSDILGIVLFYSLLSFLGPESKSEIYGEVFGNLMFTIIFSIVISYILVYLFQNIKGHDKLFLLISILLLLYAVGKLFHLSSLIIILIFGMILNNHRVFFIGGLSKLIDDDKVESVLSDFKVVTGESAFVIRTFFFIIFGWSVSVGSMFNLKSIAIGIALLIIIYVIRAICLFIFSGKNIFPQIFLAPRGLITILLFFAIPKELSDKYDFNGVLLFIILASCLIMTWSLIKHKKNTEEAEIEAELIDDEINEEDLPEIISDEIEEDN